MEERRAVIILRRVRDDAPRVFETSDTKVPRVFDNPRVFETSDTKESLGITIDFNDTPRNDRHRRRENSRSNDRQDLKLEQVDYY